MIGSIPTATLLYKASRHPLRAIRRLVEAARLSWRSTSKEREVAERLWTMRSPSVNAGPSGRQTSGFGKVMRRPIGFAPKYERAEATPRPFLRALPDQNLGTPPKYSSSALGNRICPPPTMRGDVLASSGFVGKIVCVSFT